MKRAREAWIHISLADIRAGYPEDFLRGISMVRKNAGGTRTSLYAAAVSGEIEPIGLPGMMHDVLGLVIGRTMRQIEHGPEYIGNSSMTVRRTIDVKVR